MKIVRHETVETETFRGGATYRTLVGDDAGSTPIRTGIQVSPPGYATPRHAHPYVEVITVLEGEGEGWAEGDGEPVTLKPGMTMIIPAGQKHGFKVTGEQPMKTLGIHVSPRRIVEIDDADR